MIATEFTLPVEMLEAVKKAHMEGIPMRMRIAGIVQEFMITSVTWKADSEFVYFTAAPFKARLK